MTIVKLQDIKLTHRSLLAFLYTNNEETEREIQETIPFTIATKRIKYLRINILTEKNNLYIENYKTLMKEIKMKQIDGEMYHVHVLEESI